MEEQKEEQKTVLMDESTKNKLNQIKREVEFKIGENFKFGEIVDLMCNSCNTDTIKEAFENKFIKNETNDEIIVEEKTETEKIETEKTATENIEEGDLDE